MKRSVLLLAAIALLAPIPGCGGTETGNPPFAPSVGYGGVPPMGISPDPTVESARVAMSDATMVDCEGARHPLLRAVMVDFVTGEASVGEALAIPPGSYCGIELRIAACDDPDLCRAVVPESTAVDGTRRSDAADVAIRDREVFEVPLDGGPFEVGPDEGGLLVALDLNSLVAGLSISTAAASMDGVVRIDTENNADRLPALRTGLRDGLALRRDLDDDGTLDPDELLEPALATYGGVPSP